MNRTPEQEFTVADLLAIWRRRRRAMLGVLAATVLLTVVGSLVWPKRYRSESRLLVRVGRENATLDPAASIGAAAVVASPTSREEEIASIVDVFLSRPMIERVIDVVGAEKLARSGWNFLPSPVALDARARDELIEGLASRIVVENVKKSNVVRVEYRGLEPETSQAVVSALVDAYLAGHARFHRSDGALAFLRFETSGQMDKLSRLEEELADLREETGLVDAPARRQVLVEQRGRLEESRFQVRQELAGVEKEIGELQRVLKELPPTQLIQRQLGVGNEGTDGMREQFYALRLREQQLVAQYNESHPLVQDIRRQVAAAQQILEQEELTRVVATESPNRAYEESTIQLLDAERQGAALGAREEALERHLADVDEQLSALNRDALAIARLERRIEIQDAEYRRYAANLEQARMEDALEQGRISNLSVVQPASLEVKEVSPRLGLNLVLGVLAGLAAAAASALALERCDRSLHDAEQLEREVDLRVLGSISHLPRPDQAVAGGS